MARRLVALLLAAGLITLSPAAPPSPQDDQMAKEVKRVVDIYAIAEANAADPVNSEQAFYQGAIPGLLRRLDPHSVFFDPGQFEQLKQMQASTSKGFGTVVSLLPGRVIVLQTLPGTPSARSGMIPGDEILAVNNLRLDRFDLDQLKELLMQARQQRAQIVVRRPGSARLMELTLIPEEMQAPSVERAFLLQQGVAYLRVGSFDESTGRDIQAAIEKLGGRNLKGLVLDLRNNPGGLVTAALYTASLFLKPEQTILSIRGRHSEAKEEKVPKTAEPYAFPVSVLVNEKTASASEIVAGALQDHDRATILGVPSFGKGLVQSVFPLSSGTGLALTTALYYTPSGRSIQRPLKSSDFELSETAAHLNSDKQFHTDSGRAVQGGGGITPDQLVAPELPGRLRIVLDASGSFVNFATEYLQTHKADAAFEVTAQLLDVFQSWLAARQIQPSFSEWSRERPYIQSRLQSEILNQSVGVEKGDEVEVQRDVQVRAAYEALKLR